MSRALLRQRREGEGGGGASGGETPILRINARLKKRLRYSVN